MHRNGHHEQGESPRGDDFVAQGGVVAVLDGFHIAVFLDHHVVADFAQFVLHLLEGNLGRVVFHQCRPRWQTDGSRLNAVEFVEFLFDAGRAACAHHPEYSDCLFFHNWVQS